MGPGDTNIRGSGMKQIDLFKFLKELFAYIHELIQSGLFVLRNTYGNVYAKLILSSFASSKELLTKLKEQIMFRSTNIRFFKLRSVVFTVSILLSGFISTGCNPTTNDDSMAMLMVGSVLLKNTDIELKGIWKDDWDGVYTFQNDYWIHDYAGDGEDAGDRSTIVEYDNTENIFYDQGIDSKYERIRWTTYNQKTYYCTEIYGIATLAEAKADTTRADESDPSNSGCGTFAWTKLTPQ